MTTQQLTDLTLSMLAFVPNDRQLALIHALSSFIINRGPRDVFVLNGYAETGKTSVMGATVKALRMSNVKTFLLAPTGRACESGGGNVRRQGFDHTQTYLPRRLHKPKQHHILPRRE